MSGIVGVYHRDGSGVTSADAERLVDALSRPGPDGDGTWCDGTAALGHLARYETPEARHADPPAERDRLVVTADLRLDNRPELLAALGVSAPAGQVPDSHLALAAYQQWGEHCPEHLLGAFALAVWDRDADRHFVALYASVVTD
jgi:asparagine synthase (glutamine-hydrolysing)